MSEIAQWFAHADVINNRFRIRSQIHATIRRTFRRYSQSIIGRDGARIPRPNSRFDLSSWSPRITRPSRVNCVAVLGGVNALRCASTVRPRGLRALTPPALRSNSQLRDGRGLIAIDSANGEAYVRNISLVPHGTPFTSPDVERFGTTLQGFVPTAFLIQQMIRSRRLLRCAITAPNTPSALDAKYSAFGAALRCRPFIAITNAANRESTFNMGRRIMAERGRKRGKRARRVRPVVRRAATASIDPPGDEALRALVRILARQAAREAFECEVRRNATIVH